jgi:nucleoid-associated protein YgaU
MTTSFSSNVSNNALDAKGSVGAAAGSPSLGTALAAAGSIAGAAAGLVSTVASLIPATLSCTDPRTPSQWMLIPFDFNPSKITISRSASQSSKTASGPGAGSPSGSSGVVVWKTNPPEISIGDITFEGLTTKLRCDKLLDWMSPPNGADAFAASLATVGRPIQSQIPTLRFIWGPPFAGFFYQVKLTSCTIVYERFNPMGIPVRAKVSLKMIQQVSDWANIPTNPTSGGLPGRRTHVLKSGESLHSVAHTHYGSPGAWRRIADINGITDPSRVRPGTTLYLPGAGELDGSTG